MKQETLSKVTLACAAQLVADTVVRLSGNGVSGTNNGQAITRTTIASGALHTARSELMRAAVVA